MKFKDWFSFQERLTEPSHLGDISRRADLIKGGLDGCTGDKPNTLPMGVRGMCQATTSAFPTYKLRIARRSRNELVK